MVLYSSLVKSILGPVKKLITVPTVIVDHMRSPALFVWVSESCILIGFLLTESLVPLFGFH